MSAKLKIYKDNAGEFRFRLKAANGEKVLRSALLRARRHLMPPPYSSIPAFFPLHFA